MSPAQDSGKDLTDRNSSTLGAQFPEVTLPDGSKVQTGTVGALLVNIKRYDAVHASLINISSNTNINANANDNDDHRQTIKDQLKVLEESFKPAIPLLLRLGLFDLFEPDEWMAGTKSAGRRKVGELAKEFA